MRTAAVAPMASSPFFGCGVHEKDAPKFGAGEAEWGTMFLLCLEAVNRNECE